ncbi:hypothetical protein ACH0AH_12640 [Microbacterium paludicola]|nr:hypothetical protein [Microbacterium paludicola]
MTAEHIATNDVDEKELAAATPDELLAAIDRVAALVAEVERAIDR